MSVQHAHDAADRGKLTREATSWAMLEATLVASAITIIVSPLTYEVYAAS